MTKDELAIADAEFEKIMAMSDEEILEGARQRGIDPERYAHEMRVWLANQFPETFDMPEQIYADSEWSLPMTCDEIIEMSNESWGSGYNPVREASRQAGLRYLREREAATGSLKREAERPLPPYDGPEILGQR